LLNILRFKIQDKFILTFKDSFKKIFKMGCCAEISSMEYEYFKFSQANIATFEFDDIRLNILCGSKQEAKSDALILFVDDIPPEINEE